MGHKAIFFDRDDTLLDDPGYIDHPDQVKLLPGASHAIVQLRKMGYKIVIITNQSGVARGYVTEERLEEIHQKLKKQLAAEGARIDGIYYCPYHPEGVVKDFSMESNLRKPNAGMLFQAAEDLDLDLERSWKIGDSYRDIKAGKTAGCQTILVDVPGKIREKKNDDPEPDRKAVNLREAVNIIRMVEFHEKANAAKKEKTQTEQTEPEGKPKPTPPATPESTVTESVEEKESLTLLTPAQTVKETPKVVQPELEVSEASKDEPDKQESDRARPDLQEPTPVKEESQAPAAQKPKQENPAPRKIRTVRPLNKKAEANSEHPHHKTHRLMEEILSHVKTTNREDLYDDFSIYRLLAGMIQCVAILCIILSIYFWLNPKVENYEPVQIMATYAVALQLLVIALLMMRSKD